MGQNKIGEKILELFYENPSVEFTIREISRLAKVPRATVHKYLVVFKKLGLVSKNNVAGSSLLFKTKKINFFVERIVACGLIEELMNKLNPSCILLFGSIRKGDSVKESDIDLFVESSIKKTVDVKKFERKLKHKIQIFVEPDIRVLHKNLLNNVVNGIKLFGGFKIK